MVEMLGVLAIIGVLSVGAIAGYSSAMAKYKMNKAAEQVSQIASNVYMMFVNEKDYSALGSDPTSGTANAIKLNLIPEDMIQDDGVSVKNVYGGVVQIYSVDYNNLSNGAFKIDYNMVPKSAVIYFATPTSNIENSTMMSIKIN